MEENSKDRQVYQLHKKGYEDIAKAVKEIPVNETPIEININGEAVKNVEVKYPKGDPGEPGYSPIKGKDYFTPEEISSIKDDIFSRIVIPDPIPGAPGKPADPIDYRKIEKFITSELEKIEKPEVEDDEVIDIESIVQQVLSKIPKQKEIVVDYPSIKEFCIKEIQKIENDRGSRVRTLNSGGPTTRLGELVDVNLEGIQIDQVLSWNGTEWVAKTVAASGGLETVATDATLTGDGTPGDPLSVVSPTILTDLGNLGYGNNGEVLTVYYPLSSEVTGVGTNSLTVTFTGFSLGFIYDGDTTSPGNSSGFTIPNTSYPTQVIKLVKTNQTCYGNGDTYNVCVAGGSTLGNPNGYQVDAFGNWQEVSPAVPVLDWTTPGTVTSVALSVPTGLSISGSPITTSGTLAVSLTSGYEIPQSANLVNPTPVITALSNLTGSGTDGQIAVVNGKTTDANVTGVGTDTLSIDWDNVTYDRVFAYKGTVVEPSNNPYTSDPATVLSSEHPTTYSNPIRFVQTTNTCLGNGDDYSTCLAGGASIGRTDGYYVDKDGNWQEVLTTAWVNNAGYMLIGSASIAAPADATTYYFGGPGYTPGITAGFYRVRILKSGTIKSAVFDSYYSGTAPSNETSTINMKVNTGSNNAIITDFKNDVNGASFSNTALAIDVVAGDYIEFNWVTPTWATNPGTSSMIKWHLYIE